MTYAFTFDASACSGCKACQVACKDKNNLPAGVLWRRVYEISGGSWQQIGDAWVTDVFTYNLSIACNHCVHPKCAGVCPTDAFVVREDGIVYINASKCIGCGYCNWACPYAAPQYNPHLGCMTKCNFCFDNIDAGLPPACVAACPMRVLDFIEVESDPLPEFNHLLWQMPGSEHPFPLPNFSRTEPHLAIKPHAGMLNELQKTVSNREEIKPINSFKTWRFLAPKSSRSTPQGLGFGEWPLVSFTLLGQMAAGMAVLSLWTGPLTIPLLIVLGGLISLAGVSSLLHLGNPVNAWRSVTHLKKSWLSREILVFMFFGASWLIALAMPGMGKGPLAACGIGLVYSMAQVYRLRAVPAWNSNQTLLQFAISAVLLGGLGMASIYAITSARNTGYLVLVLLAAASAFAVEIADRVSDDQTVRRLRLGLIGFGLASVLAMVILPFTVGRWILFPTFFIIVIEEVLGRWLFYEKRQQRD